MAHSKRDATAAGLPLNPMPNMGQRHSDHNSDSEEQPFPSFAEVPQSTVDVSADASSHTYTSPGTTVPPPPFLCTVDAPASHNSRAFCYSQYGNDRTVHTITFKLWNQASRANKELFIQETRHDGNTVSYDTEHFFQELVGDQAQANRLSDYWRSFYDVPTRHTAAATHPSVQLTDQALPSNTDTLSSSHSTSDLALALFGKLFGPHGHDDPHGTVHESSWPATELSISERESLHSLLTKLSNSSITCSSFVDNIFDIELSFDRQRLFLA